MGDTLKLTTRGDREIVMTRMVDAPRQMVFDAFTKPELVRHWLLGPDGWSMPSVATVPVTAGVVAGHWSRRCCWPDPSG